MNKDYISTDSLYNYLAHARTYSHKYIKREPDGKGGYRYWYKTDITSGRGNTYNSYANERGAAWASKNADYNNSVMLFGPAQRIGSGVYRQTPRSTDYMRTANKASEIYREGLPDNMPSRSRRNGPNSNVQDHINSKPQSNSSRPTVSGSSNVTTWDNANIKTWDNANVKTWDNANIKTWDNANIKTWANSVAQQAVGSITTAAKNTYNAGMNFLKKLFS